MQRFEASLRENQEPVHLLLPSLEIALAMKQGVGTLIRQAGLQLMQLVMEWDVEQMLGPRYQQAEGRSGWRWGKEKGLVPHRRAEGAAGSTAGTERGRRGHSVRELPVVPT